MLKELLCMLLVLCTMMSMTGASAEALTYVGLEKTEYPVVKGDFSARAVIERTRDNPNLEAGIRFYYTEDRSYYAFFVRWTDASRCDFYGTKYVAGQNMGFLIAEEYQETGKDCYVSVDEAWDAQDDTAMTLTVDVLGSIATVTMTGNNTGYSGTLHFDLTKSARMDGKLTEANPVVFREGMIRRASRGTCTYTFFGLDQYTYEGDTIVWPEKEKAALDASYPTAETYLGTLRMGTFTPGTYQGSEFTVPYQIWLPSTYTPEKDYPVLLFLHGDGSRGSDNRQIVEGSSEFIICREIAARDMECIILVPQSPVSWVFTPEPADNFHRNCAYEDVRPSKCLQAVLEMLDDMTANMNVDASRLYLNGYSRGSFAGWYLLATCPERFAAAILCCGVGSPEMGEAIARTPIYVFHGTVDDVVSYEDGKAMADAAAAAGGDVTFVPAEGLAHSISATMRRDKNVIDWLFSKSR